jgi:hypothetical protein
LATMGVSSWVAITIVLVAIVAMVRAYLKREADPFVRRLVPIALAAKVLGTFAYYFVLENVYGRGDVTGYINAGRRLAPAIRSGALPENALDPGTRFTEFLTGLLFSVVGSNVLIGYLVFSMLSFIGMVLLFHAFRKAMPDGDHHRYALMVLLLPTMLFWPSTIGKDTWVIFTLGIAAYGSARVLRREHFGYLLVTVGLVAMAMVRPHMAALFAVSFMAAFLVRLGDASVKRSAAGWAVGLALIGVGVSFALLNFSEEMGRSETGEDAPISERITADVDEIFDRTDQLTSRDAGGTYDSRPVRSPLDLLHAIVTVPLRPFPWEGHNYQAQIAGLEGLLLLGLVLAALPRLTALPVRLMRTPYVMLATVYTLGFIVAFSNVGNFGILTRQRAQMVPMLLVLLALPKPNSDTRSPANPAGKGGRSPVVRYLPAATATGRQAEDRGHVGSDTGTPSTAEGPVSNDRPPFDT